MFLKNVGRFDKRLALSVSVKGEPVDNAAYTGKS